MFSFRWLNRHSISFKYNGKFAFDSLPRIQLPLDRQDVVQQNREE